MPFPARARTVRNRFAAIAAGVALVLGGGCWTGAHADALTVQGSTSVGGRLMVPHRAAIEAASGHSLTVVPNRSNLGVLALFEGRADLAMISTSLDNEIALLRRTNPELPVDRLRSFEVLRTRVAFALHPSNPVRTLSRDALGRVLMGGIANWRELGGPDLPIRLVAVRDGGGNLLTVEAELLEGRKVAAADIIRVQNGPQVITVVKQEPRALGVSQASRVREHNLPEIELETPIEQQFNLVSLGEPTPAMRAVIDAARKVAATTEH